MKLHHLIGAALVAGLISTTAAATTIEFQGTGLRIEAPPGMYQTPAGTSLIDDSGETIMNFAAGPSKSSLENNPAWRKLYENAPERIQTPNIAGNLYKRTRANDGGKWDGWFLSVPRGDKNLTVLVSYTGSSKETFERLRNHLLTISWDDTKSDREQAMGFRLSPEGLKAVPNGFGALAYNESGQLGAPGPQISAQLLPMSTYKTDEIFPSGCGAAVLGRAFSGKPFEGPNVREYNGIKSCDAWSKYQDSEMQYVSLVRLPSGALIFIMGSAPSNQFKDFLPRFRKAVYELKLFTRDGPASENRNSRAIK